MVSSPAGAPELLTLSATIVAGSPDPILVAKSDGSWIEANPAAVALLGYKLGALLRLSVTDILAPGTVWTADAQARIIWEGRWQGDVSVRVKDGRLIPVEARAILIRGPEESLVVWFLRDMTVHKQVEEKLRAALAVAERGHLAKGVFLDMMSHEMRTPLQAVLGYSEFLLISPPETLTGEQREDVAYIHRAGKRLISLVDQALDLSRMDAGGIIMASEPVDLAEVIETVRQDVAPQAVAKAIEVEIALPLSLPAVLGDAERVRQILLNLVSNAVKFTDHGQVSISASGASGGVEIEVRDTGRGIAADELPHIFEAFHQVPDRSPRRHSGSGLGLAIAARLAEQMAGSISVVSEPGMGTTFSLYLPCVPT